MPRLRGRKGMSGEDSRVWKRLGNRSGEAAEEPEQEGSGGSDVTACALAVNGFSSASLLSSLAQVSKSREAVSGWPSLSLSCGDGLRSSFLQPLKREETSASHQDYAQGGNLKGCWCY